MNHIIWLAGLALTVRMACAEDIRIPVDGKDMYISFTVLNHEITLKDKDSTSQKNAVGCSFLFHKFLAENEVEKACVFTTDFGNSLEKWTNYQKRIGEKNFKKIMEEYFTAKYVILAELVKGTAHMLVVQPPDGIESAAAQMYVKKGNKFVLDEAMDSGDAKELLKLLPMIQDGILKLKEE